MNKCLYLILLLSLWGCEKEVTLDSSTEELLFTWEENVKTITLEPDLQWGMSSQMSSWLSIKDMRKEENGGISYNIIVAENKTGLTRYHDIIFIASNKQKTIHVIQKAKEKLLFIGKKEYVVGSSASELLINIDGNVDYEVSISKNATKWITANTKSDLNDLLGSLNELEGQKNNELKLQISDSSDNKERQAEIVIYNNDFKLSDTLYVTQEAGRETYTYSDGEYVLLRQASKGDVNIVVMGDGFIKDDMSTDGHYETIMRQAIDNFFSIEPYTSYRDYFNVYMVVAESAEAGVSEKGSLKKVRNKFGSTYGQGTEITCNNDLCFEYVGKVKELPADVPVTVIVVLNSTKYAGTTYLYADGNSIALCPMSTEKSPNDFEGLVHHEAGGHGFGFLCDEYVYYKRAMPEERKREIKEWQKMGFQLNLDFTDDPSSVLWSDFIGQDKYMSVGIYEGGYEYQYGVWRSEDNSCMNNNIPYFNVQSRWSIVNRIMKLSGKPFTIQEFIESDHPIYPVKTNARSIKQFVPLGNPKWMK